MNVLFVCSGNICRSPMAEVLFRAHAERRGLPCTVRSAGLLTVGEPAATGATTAMAARGVDLTGHRSDVLRPEMIDESDLVLTMERQHLRAAVARRSDAFDRIYTLADLVGRSRRRGGPTDEDHVATWLRRMHQGRSRRAQFDENATDEIADPLGSGAAAFEAAARRLDALISSLIGSMAMIDVRPLTVDQMAAV